MNEARTVISSRRREWLISGVGIFALALLVRVVHVLQIRAAPFFDLKLGDAESYDSSTREIAAGNWLGNEVFYQAPLYPYFLGILYSVMGDHPLVLRLAQAVVGAFSCLLIARAARRLFSEGVGIAAGVMLALYPPAIFYGSLVQKNHDRLSRDRTFEASIIYLKINYKKL